jgi:branched-chain amino acid transport system substrate-binding protein
MKKFWIVLGVVVVGVLIVVLAVTQTKKESVQMKIGALLALTGSGANYGKSLQQGIELAREEINQKGGINGIPLSIIYEDSQGDAKTGINAFNKLVSINKVPVVIGSISSVILSVAPIADEKQVILLNSSAISPKICDQAKDFLFSIMVSGAQEARFMAQDYVKQYKNKPIAVLYSNNSSGIDTRDTFVRELKSVGGQIAIEEAYELGATDFKTQLAKLRNSKAKFGYLIAFSSREFAAILKQSKEMALGIQWYSYSGFETKETLEFASNAAEGVIYSYPDYSSQKDLMENFQKKYQERYGSWADIYTVTSYDGVNMLAKIISTYGTTPPQIQNGLRQAGAYKGIFGDIQFHDNQCVTKLLIWKTVKNGQYTSQASR